MTHPDVPNRDSMLVGDVSHLPELVHETPQSGGTPILQAQHSKPGKNTVPICQRNIYIFRPTDTDRLLLTSNFYLHTFQPTFLDPNSIIPDPHIYDIYLFSTFF